MKLAVRILLVISAIAVFVFALLPREESAESTDAPAPSTAGEPPDGESPDPSSPVKGGVVRDVLGGAALDAGQRAKDKISEINKIREDQVKEVP